LSRLQTQAIYDKEKYEHSFCAVTSHKVKNMLSTLTAVSHTGIENIPPGGDVIVQL
jgi:hypothetical protein